MTWENLKDYVSGSVTDQEYINECWNEAILLVNHFVGDAIVPATALSRAYLEVGSELYHRRQAPNGVAQFQTLDGAAIRVARDPMVGAYPILQRWTGLGVA